MLQTKESRLKSQEAQIENLLTYGYKKESYNGLIILTQISDKDNMLKVFRDSAANAVVFERYKDLSRMQNRIEGLKQGQDRRIQRKLEEKQNRTKSSTASASGAIKAELKSLFPHVKFSVRGETFSGGDSVSIEWTDGPSVAEVEVHTAKYQYGSFNSMEDMYENTNSRSDIPQAKYIRERREMSDQLKEILMPDAERFFEDGWGANCRDAHNLLHRVWYANSIPNGAVIKGLKRNDADCGVSWPETFLVFDMEIPESTTSKAIETRPEKIEVEPGKIQVVQYSEKSIAVIGDTKPIKDKLKSLGGKFNMHLSCGAGWVFPLSKLESIQQSFSN